MASIQRSTLRNSAGRSTSGTRHTIAPPHQFSYTLAMTSPRLSPGAADALLFDLGRVVIDIDFNKALECWADHAGCDSANLGGRFARDEIYMRHEKGEISDAEYFEGLRSSLGVDLSDAEFLEGWNAIFAGEMTGIAPLLQRAAKRLPLYAFSNTNAAHVEHFSQVYADVLGHFREIFLSSSIGLRKPDAVAFDHVVNAIGVPASRIVFFDDLAENIDGARARGLRAVHVTSPDDVAAALAALGI
jgi:FMN phosphatase YigB (HAD superfamily)